MFSRVQHGQSARKRRKLAHTNDASPEEDVSPQALNTSPAAAIMPAVKEEDTAGALQLANQCCDHEVGMKMLEPELEAVRQLISCKICQRYMTEPYSLLCGHTYCYICLNTWLVSQSKRSCPECRARVTAEPHPSFVVKEIVHIFSRSHQLLPEGETLEEIQQSATEAATKVMDDRGDDGTRPLFSGIFSGASGRHNTFLDRSDNVVRCGACGYEIEDGMCSNTDCFHHDHPYSSDDNDYSLEDLDEDSEDDEPAYGGAHRAAYSSEGESSSSEEDNSEMEDFIVDDPVSEDIDSAAEDAAVAWPPVRRGRAIVVDSDSEGDDTSDDSEGSNITVRTGPTEQSAVPDMYSRPAAAPRYNIFSRLPKRRLSSSSSEHTSDESSVTGTSAAHDDDDDDSSETHDSEDSEQPSDEDEGESDDAIDAVGAQQAPMYQGETDEDDYESEEDYGY